MGIPEITIATPADRARVLQTVAAAFVADPAYRFFCPDDATYDEDAAALAGGLFDQRVGFGTVWLADGGVSVALWEPPRPVPPVVPLSTVARFAKYDAIVHTALPTTPHWYLGVLATHPEHRGRRLGRAVLAPGLARAAADGLPAYLETSTWHNVEMYRRSGFEVMDERMVDDLPVWIMATAG